MPKIAVGSVNPTKIKATKLAFEKIFPGENWEIVSVKVNSEIPDQPMNHNETIQGARNRAKNAIEAENADFGVGLEGGIQELDGKWFEAGWIVVRNKKGDEGIGSSFHVQIPPTLIKHIKEGKELGTATDIAFDIIDSGKKSGFFGLMTNEHVDRTSAYADGVIAALTRFLHQDLF